MPPCYPWVSTNFQRRTFPASGPFVTFDDGIIKAYSTWVVQGYFKVNTGYPGSVGCTGTLTFQQRRDGGPWKPMQVTGASHELKNVEPDLPFPDQHRYQVTWRPTLPGVYQCRVVLSYAGDPLDPSVFDYPSNQITWQVREYIQLGSVGPIPASGVSDMAPSSVVVGPAPASGGAVLSLKTAAAGAVRSGPAAVRPSAVTLGPCPCSGRINSDGRQATVGVRSTGGANLDPSSVTPLLGTSSGKAQVV